MKKIFLVFIILVGNLFANNDLLQVYAKYDQGKIQLKWIVSNSIISNRFEVYKMVDSKELLLGKTKPKSKKMLEKQGYTQEYIEYIYPTHPEFKTMDQQISYTKGSQKAQGFKVLKLIKDNLFAQNLGQFFVDGDVKKGQKYTYKIVYYVNSTKKAEKTILVDTNRNFESRVFFINAKEVDKHVELNWSTDNSYSFYFVYRKLQSEKNFKKLVGDPIYYAPNSKSIYKDDKLQAGLKAQYYVTKLDSFGKEGPASKIVEAMISKEEKPTIVQNFSLQNKDTRITLRWQEQNDALGYNIYRNSSYQGVYEKLNEKPIVGNVYFDKNFNVGSNHYYYVTAVNKQGESKPSQKLLSYAKDVTPPSMPTSLKASTSPGIVNLVWEHKKSNDILGYRVYFAMDKNASEWSMEAKDILENKFSHKLSKKLSRYQYFYYVTAVDKAYNESAPSNIVTVQLPDVTAPKEPIITQKSIYTKKAILSWNAIDIYDFDHYNVYLEKDGKQIKLNEKPLKQTTFEHIFEKPMQGKANYIVTSVDKYGNESSKNNKFEVVYQDIDGVKIESISYGINKESVTIKLATKDKDYNGFEVFRSSGTNNKFYNVSAFQTGYEYKDQNVAKNQFYWYQIKLYDKSGNVTLSDVKMIEFK